MKPSEDSKLLEIVKATAEIYGKQISLAAAVMFLADLDAHDSNTINAALSKCRKELRNFPTVADVIARIDDGRPGAEEAWSLIPQDESGSTVWTEEMQSAYGIAKRLLDEGDAVAARMAFRESYTQKVSEARLSGTRARWTPSLGHDVSGRQVVISEAVRLGRLPMSSLQEIAGNEFGIVGFDVKKLLKQIPKESK